MSYIKDFRQPVVETERGSFFKPNKVALTLVSNLVHSYNELMILKTGKNVPFDEAINRLIEVIIYDNGLPKEDKLHFLQLIGTTVSAYEEMCKKIDAND